MRLFLTGLIGQAGTLSEETSVCIRRGFSGFDLRSMMLASATGEMKEQPWREMKGQAWRAAWPPSS